MGLLESLLQGMVSSHQQFVQALAASGHSSSQETPNGPISVATPTLPPLLKFGFYVSLASLGLALMHRGKKRERESKFCSPSDFNQSSRTESHWPYSRSLTALKPITIAWK